MKIVLTADYQGMAKDINPNLIPDGDILIVAGDIGGWGVQVREYEDFNDWLGLLPNKYKIIISGNHDLLLEEIEGIGKSIFEKYIYLENEGIEIEGIKIWGSPVSYNNPQEVPYFRAFSENEKEQCDMIPEGLDILITHGPPYGVLDQLEYTKRHIGSNYILKAIERGEPKYHIFGHIHESAGVKKIGKTTFANVALCDEMNNLFDKKGQLVHDPMVIEI